MAVLTLTLADAAALRAVFDQQLSKKRAFLVGSGGVCERESCELSIELGARSFRVTGEVVYVKAEEPGRGVGLSLGGIDEARMAALAAFVAECEAACGAPGAAGEGAGEDAEGTEGEEAAEEEEGEGAQAPLRMHERIRSLSGIEQQKLAATGSLAERTALERMYGPNVWETLLRNPRLTIPEVARIARKGTLPRPLAGGTRGAKLIRHTERDVTGGDDE